MINIYNMKDELTLSKEIQVEYFQLGNVDLLHRPQVPGQTLIDAGWTDAGTGTATVYTNSYSAGTDGIEWDGPDIIIHITPIRTNGTVLGPDALDSYVDGLLGGSTIESVLTADSTGLVLWVQKAEGGWDASYERGELYDDLLHRLQAVYYLENYEEFPPIDELQEFNENISLYPSFDGNGDAILTPISGSHRQIAGGNYDLTMVHPIDPEGKWTHLVPDAIIKAPVPEETIENAFSGLDVDVYKTTEKAALRSGPSEPTTITYPQWVSGATYSVGAKVSYGNQNYQCTNFDETSGYIMVPPPNSPWWTKIARTTPGSPLLVNLKAGTDLYYVSGPSDGWYYMSTTYGLEGYIKASQITYDRHLTPAETQPRTITTQLFRIRTVTVNTKEMRVTVNAQHVSYDLNGVLIDHIKLVRKPPAEALAWLESAYMIDYQGTIATNMTSNADTSYSAEISGKSGMFALLDPDQGVVPTFDAEFRRDNWDLFVMAKTNTDRGFRIRYGNNLLGVNWKINGDKLVTRVVPVAKDEDGEDLYLDGTKWIDSMYVSNFPVIRMERLKVSGQVGKDDGTETNTNWTTTTLRAEMRKQAEARFSVDKCDQIQHEITVDFERLGDTAEYAQYKALQQVLMYDTVVVADERVGLGASVTVSEIEYDIIKEKIRSLKLTNVNPYNVKNVSGFNVLVNTITGDKLTDDAGDEIIVEAVDIAVDESNDYTDKKAAQTLKSSKDYTEDYVGDNHGYSSFEAYIKAYCDGRYEKK